MLSYKWRAACVMSPVLVISWAIDPPCICNSRLRNPLVFYSHLHHTRTEDVWRHNDYGDHIPPKQCYCLKCRIVEYIIQPRYYAHRQWGSLMIAPLPMMTSSDGNIFRVTGPLCGEFTGPGEFPAQRPVTRSSDVFFDLRLNKRLSKQPWGWWFETPSWSLWRQCNEWSYPTEYK